MANFDMQRIGANIMKLRKAAGYTQMQLANELGISFQAVSNWERGQSCPDISNLGELSKLLNCSVDDILGSERAAEIVKKVESEPAPSLEPDEFKEVAPILEEKQADDIAVKMSKSLKLKELTSVAPFLSQKYVDKLAEKAVEETDEVDMSTLTALAPFVSSSVLEKLAMKIADGYGVRQITGLAPFLSGETVLRLFTKVQDDPNADMHTLTALAPFVPTASLDEIVLDCVRRGDDLSSVTGLAPFLSGHVVSEIAAMLLERDGLRAIAPLMPFVDQSVLEDYLDRL